MPEKSTIKPLFCVMHGVYRFRTIVLKWALMRKVVPKMCIYKLDSGYVGRLKY